VGAKRKEHGMPPPGSVYKRNYKGKLVSMQVVKGKDRVFFRVNDRDYESPSGAAKAVTETSVNGWLFWGIEGR